MKRRVVKLGFGYGFVVGLQGRKDGVSFKKTAFVLVGSALLQLYEDTRTVGCSDASLRSLYRINGQTLLLWHTPEVNAATT